MGGRLGIAASLRQNLARRRLTVLPSPETVDVAIVGGGIGGVALALAISRNNALLQSAVRCAQCGALIGTDPPDGGVRKGAGRSPLTAEPGITRRMIQHHEQVHADRHTLSACFPGALAPDEGGHQVSSVAISGNQLSACFPGAEPQARELSVRAFEKDATFAARHQGYGLTMQQGSAVLERLGLADAARAEDTPSEAHWVFEDSGALLNAFSSKEFGRARAPSDSAHWERHRNLTIPRQRLRELLLDKLSKDHDPQLMQWGWQYAGHAKCADGRVAVEFVRPAATARAATAEGAELRGVVAGAELRGVVAGAEPAAPQQPLERRTERRTVLARVLVGADGLWSAVRERTLRELAQTHADRARHDANASDGDSRDAGVTAGVTAVTAGDSRDAGVLSNRLEYLGVIVVLGIAPSGTHPLCTAQTFEMISPQSATRLYAMPFGQQQTFWQLSFRCSLTDACRYSRDRAALNDEIRTRCGEWHEPVPSLLRRTPAHLITAYPVYDRCESYPFLEALPAFPFLEALPTHAATGVAAGVAAGAAAAGAAGAAAAAGLPIVTLIGDAAHPMSPFKGQGANQALLDAVQLADALAIADFGSPAAAAALVRESERRMHARSERQRRRSRAAVATLHSQDVRVAATTGKEGPSEELLEAFREARLGCWDAEGGQIVSKLRQVLKAMRRRESRRRVRERVAAAQHCA